MRPLLFLLLLLLPILCGASIIHTGFPSNSVVQDYVNYAYKISNQDMDFVLTLQEENGARDPLRKSKREPSYGFCQMHMRRQSKTINDPRFFKDPYWQLDQCWYKYRTGTPFYGYNKRLRHVPLFKSGVVLGDSDNPIRWDRSRNCHILVYAISKGRIGKNGVKTICDRKPSRTGANAILSTKP